MTEPAIGIECGCCADCRAAVAVHWVSDFWRYCPHTRVMSKRRQRAEPWTLVRRVSPREARRHLEKAIKLMSQWMRARGINPDQADALLTWYREVDPDSPRRSASDSLEGRRG